MFLKLLKLFLFMLVAFAGVSALMFTAYSASMQDTSDRTDFNRSIPATKPAENVQSPNVNQNFQFSNEPDWRYTAKAALPKPTVRPLQSESERQIRSMLNNSRIEQMETRQRYGAAHPNVRRLDKKVELLEAQLKAETETTATRPTLTPEQLELQQKIERAEEQASKSASLLTNTDVQDEESKRSIRDKLKKLVQEAFDLRMRLQNAQLDDAQKKLEASRRRLLRRQSLAKQIVQRRVNELLGRDETKWALDPKTASNSSTQSPDKQKTTQEKVKTAQEKPQTTQGKPNTAQGSVDERLTRFSTFEVAKGLEGYHAEIPELEAEWRIRYMNVDSTAKPFDESHRLRISSNDLLVSGLSGLINDKEKLGVYLVKGMKNKLLIRNFSINKDFHLASFQITGSLLQLAIRKSTLDLDKGARRADFPALKPASNVIYLQCEASIGLRSLDGLDFGDPEHFFQVQNSMPEGKTILESKNGDLRQIGKAERIATLQGRWIANKVSLDGDDVALTDSFKLYLQNTRCIQFGTTILTNEHGKSVHMFANPRDFAHRDKGDSFIIVRATGRGVKTGYVGSFSRQQNALRLAIRKLGHDMEPPVLSLGDMEPPALSPSKGVLYMELQQQDTASDPIQLQFVEDQTTANHGTVHIFDARNSDDNTTYSVTRLECDTAFEAPGFGLDVSRLETQITLKPGEVRRIEVPVNNGDSDWRVWLRGGPADEILPDKWTPVLGFFANLPKSNARRSRGKRPQKTSVRDRQIRGNGTARQELSKAIIEQRESQKNAQPRSVAAPTGRPAIEVTSLVDPLHQVGPGDVLSVFVPFIFDEMDRGPTSPGYPIHVKSDGMIALPLKGRLKAAGKTALEIENELKNKYVDETEATAEGEQEPILEEEYRDFISVVVQQVFKPAPPVKHATPTSSGQRKFAMLGQWEVVSIKGKGGRFMTLNESTKIGDRLMIPNYIYLTRLGNKRELVVKRRWFSDEIEARWTKNDSLDILGGNFISRMTYRSKNGDKKHLNDPEDPPEFAIYKLRGDELTLVAGDPNDFTIKESRIRGPRHTAGDNSDEPEKLIARQVFPNYAKDFYLPPGERQLWVKLRRVVPAAPKAPSSVENADIIRPFPVGNQPPASALAPYALRYEGGSKTPSSLLKRGKPDADGVPSYTFCAAADPVEQLQGRWQATRISIEGQEVVLDSALANKLQMSELTVDGQLMFGAKPDRREYYLLAYPDIPDAAILVAVDDQTRTTSLRFSVNDDKLKVAIWDTYNQADPPQLKPNDDIIYIEYERAPADRSELSPAPATPSPVAPIQKVKTYYVGDLVAPMTKQKRESMFERDRSEISIKERAAITEKDFLPIIDLIKSTVNSDSWEGEEPGTINVYLQNLSLIVSQTEPILQQVEELLEKLREINEVMVKLESHIVIVDESSDLAAESFASTTPQGFKRRIQAIDDDVLVSSTFPTEVLFNGESITHLCKNVTQGKLDSIRLQMIVTEDRKAVSLRCSNTGLPATKPTTDRTVANAVALATASPVAPDKKDGRKDVVIRDQLIMNEGYASIDVTSMLKNNTENHKAILFVRPTISRQKKIR